MATTTKACEACGERFEASRPTVRFCCYECAAAMAGHVCDERCVDGHHTEWTREEVELTDEASLRANGQAYAVGDEYVTWAAAPGTGRTTYKVSRIEGGKVYGVQVASTVRELTPAEVI
jgi:hypothetical protein